MLNLKLLIYYPGFLNIKEFLYIVVVIFWWKEFHHCLINIDLEFYRCLRHRLHTTFSELFKKHRGIFHGTGQKVISNRCLWYWFSSPTHFVTYTMFSYIFFYTPRKYISVFSKNMQQLPTILRGLLSNIFFYKLKLEARYWIYIFIQKVMENLSVSAFNWQY